MNGKLQVLYSREQGFTVPAEPSPARLPVNSQQPGSREDKTPVLLLLPKWGCEP